MGITVAAFARARAAANEVTTMGFLSPVPLCATFRVVFSVILFNMSFFANYTSGLALQSNQFKGECMLKLFLSALCVGFIAVVANADAANQPNHLPVIKYAFCVSTTAESCFKNGGINYGNTHDWCIVIDGQPSTPACSGQPIYWPDSGGGTGSGTPPKSS